MRESQKRMWSILVGMSFVIASLIMISLFVRPAISENQNLRAEKNFKEEILKNRQEAVNQVQNLVTEYQGGQKVEELLLSVLPEGENIPGAVNHIQGLAAINNLVLNSVNVEVDKEEEIQLVANKESILDKNYKKIKIDFDLSGGYAGFKNFIQDLESNIRLLDVEGVKIKSQGGIINYNVTVNAYYQ